MAASPDAKTPPVRAVLLFHDGAGNEARLELSGAEVHVGRSAECAVRFDDATVSRRHARVFLDGGRWHVADFGSSERAAHHALASGDVIRCGGRQVVYREEPIALAALGPLVAPVLRVLAGEIDWIDDPRAALDGRARFRGGVRVSGTGREDWVFDSGAEVSQVPITVPLPERVRIVFPDGRVVEIAGAEPWFVATGPCQRPALPHGEIAALLEDGWSPGGTSESWVSLPRSDCILHVRAAPGGWTAMVQRWQR